MRHTSAHSKNRRSHHALSKPRVVTAEDGAVTLRHRMDPKKGTYRGKTIKEPVAEKVRVTKDHVHDHAEHEHDAEKKEITA